MWEKVPRFVNCHFDGVVPNLIAYEQRLIEHYDKGCPFVDKEDIGSFMVFEERVWEEYGRAVKRTSEVNLHCAVTQGLGELVTRFTLGHESEHLREVAREELGLRPRRLLEAMAKNGIKNPEAFPEIWDPEARADVAGFYAIWLHGGPREIEALNEELKGREIDIWGSITPQGTIHFDPVLE